MKFTIELTTLELQALEQFAEDQRYMHKDELNKTVNITPEGIVAAFVADLVGSKRSNGSDERDLAQQWYDRTWMGAAHHARLARFSKRLP